MLLILLLSPLAPASDLASLPEWKPPQQPPAGDWLIDPSPYKAGVYRSASGKDLVLANGLIARTFRLSPNAATVGLDNLFTGESILRGVKPEAIVSINRQRTEIGGLKGQPNLAFLRPEWIDAMRADPSAFQFAGFEIGKPAERMAWKRVRHHAPGATWPPPGVYLRMDYTKQMLPGIRVSVHYELYDGLPCYSKWITVHNGDKEPITLDGFASEYLAAVERISEVDELSVGRTPPNIHVETDMSFGGMMAAGANRRSYRWIVDAEYQTQVNYEKRTPCLLEVGPDLGPAQEIAPGQTFESFRAWVLPFDDTDRERCGLAMRRMYRTIAPWVTENPLMLHVRYADERTVTAAIDQCAAVGFEMVILTFGSGFNMENPAPQTLERAKKYAQYAKSKGIEIGSYSLLASRSVGNGNDVVMPPNRKPTFGASPCLCSAWGQGYFKRLYEFHRESGFALLEHDGSYPGDECKADHHPGHKGLEDSRWNQWRTIAAFYAWCRGEGIYLNVPDHYFLSGSNKTGMGYRESNWSLPREQQVIHTRQNIYDGTWEKTPTMGWMFVPLTEYHGGGAAATIEPLDQHLDHYERMLSSNLALGVQACYRGPRLYDTDRTRDMVKRWVGWYKAHRDILESDLVHGRRADARDLDWMLHVNPALKEKGMLVVFNPLSEPAERTLRVNLHYTGLRESATIRGADGTARKVAIRGDGTADIAVRVEGQGMSWYAVE